MHIRRLFYIGFAFTLFTLSMAGQAKTKKVKAVKAQPQDEIQVVGHLSLTGGAVTRFAVTQHYNSTYLYAEHNSGANVTLIDVTNSAQPAIVAEVPSLPNAGSSSVFAAAGTAALVGGQAADQQANPASAARPQNFRIMDFSDPQQPKVTREFAGVTAISTGHGYIFLANADGIWILRQRFAEDPADQKAYYDYLMYNR